MYRAISAYSVSTESILVGSILTGEVRRLPISRYLSALERISRGQSDHDIYFEEVI